MLGSYVLGRSLSFLCLGKVFAGNCEDLLGELQMKFEGGIKENKRKERRKQNVDIFNFIYTGDSRSSTPSAC